MAIRTKTQIESIYLTPTGIWLDNTTGEITPSDLRAGVQDFLDTIYNDAMQNTSSGSFMLASTSGNYMPRQPSSGSFGNITTGNYTNFEANTGFPINYGSGCAWDDLRIPGETVGAGASAPDRINFVNTSGIQVYGFDGGNISETVYFSCQIPHNAINNPVLHPHVHWTPTTNTTGYVKWFLQYTWADIFDTFQSPVIISGVTLASGGAWKHMLTEFPAISGHGSGVSSMLMCRLYRVPSDSQDTYTSDAAFLEFDFHYIRDSNGSRQEYYK